MSGNDRLARIAEDRKEMLSPADLGLTMIATVAVIVGAALPWFLL